MHLEKRLKWLCGKENTYIDKTYIGVLADERIVTRISWVPGHVDLAANRLVDGYAKEAAPDTTESQLLIQILPECVQISGRKEAINRQQQQQPQQQHAQGSWVR